MVELEEFKFNFQGKNFKIKVRRVDSFVGRGRGLTFRSRETASLLFEFERDRGLAITSFFVFFDFLAVWLDSENNVLDLEVVKPFTFSILPEKKFTKLIEIPVNESTSDLVGKLVGKRKI